MRTWTKVKASDDKEFELRCQPDMSFQTVEPRPLFISQKQKTWNSIKDFVKKSFVGQSITKNEELKKTFSRLADKIDNRLESPICSTCRYCDINYGREYIETEVDTGLGGIRQVNKEQMWHISQGIQAPPIDPPFAAYCTRHHSLIQTNYLACRDYNENTYLTRQSKE